MPLPAPDQSTVARLAEAYGLGLTAEELPDYTAAAGGMLASWQRVEELYAEIAPHPPQRAWRRPPEAENPRGAWYVTCEIPGAAEGPLAGKRVAIKDNTMVAGVPMMNGSATLEGFTPVRDATIVTRLLAAGATIAGKAVCEDLCFSGGSLTPYSGPVRNPWNPAKQAGGSSGGSAALVASGAVDLATGGDQGGSVRIPAAFCGIVGHKPTHGLVPYTGAFPIEFSIDHLGPMTRTVADAATMLTVMAGADGKDARQPAGVRGADYTAEISRGADGLRIGVVTEGFGIPDLSQPGVDAAVRAAVEALAGAGLTAAEVSIPWHRDGMALWNVIATEGATWQMMEGNAYGLNYDAEYDPELIAYYGKQWPERAADLAKTVKATMLGGRYALDVGRGAHYAMARNLAFELRAAYDAALSTYDVLVMPTLPIVASDLPTEELALPAYLERALNMVGNTAPIDVAGHPATSVPCGLVDGLPVGLMIVGKRFEDATPLRVAAAYEATVGGFPTPGAGGR